MCGSEYKIDVESQFIINWVSIPFKRQKVRDFNHYVSSLTQLFFILRSIDSSHGTQHIFYPISLNCGQNTTFYSFWRLECQDLDSCTDILVELFESQSVIGLLNYLLRSEPKLEHFNRRLLDLLVRRCLHFAMFAELLEDLFG